MIVFLRGRALGWVQRLLLTLGFATVRDAALAISLIECPQCRAGLAALVLGPRWMKLVDFMGTPAPPCARHR